MLSSCCLVGPYSQLANMFTPARRVAASAYLGTLVLTLWVTFAYPHWYLIAPLTAVQFARCAACSRVSSSPAHCGLRPMLTLALCGVQPAVVCRRLLPRPALVRAVVVVLAQERVANLKR